MQRPLGDGRKTPETKRLPGPNNVLSQHMAAPHGRPSQVGESEALRWKHTNVSGAALDSDLLGGYYHSGWIPTLVIKLLKFSSDQQADLFYRLSLIVCIVPLLFHPSCRPLHPLTVRMANCTLWFKTTTCVTGKHLERHKETGAVFYHSHWSTRRAWLQYILVSYRAAHTCCYLVKLKERNTFKSCNYTQQSVSAGVSRKMNDHTVHSFPLFYLRWKDFNEMTKRCQTAAN